MYRYIIRRLIAMPLLLLGVVTVAFIISHATHADPLASIIGDRAAENPDVVAAAKERWGLDRSLPEQYLIYIGNLVERRPRHLLPHQAPGRCTDIAERLPATLELVVAAMILGHAGGRGARRAGRRPAATGWPITPPGSSRCSAPRSRSSGRG